MYHTLFSFCAAVKALTKQINMVRLLMVPESISRVYVSVKIILCIRIRFFFVCVWGDCYSLLLLFFCFYL